MADSSVGSNGRAFVIAKDRALVVIALFLVVGLAWAYLVSLGRSMSDGGGMTMSAMVEMPLDRDSVWTLSNYGITISMWVVMMVAMMIPSATPMILLFSTVSRQRRQRGEAHAQTGLFILGYAVVWSLFAVAIGSVQLGLQSAALVSDSLRTTNAVLGAAILIAAGVYQLSPLKSVCLTSCKSPLSFLLTSWKDGTGGAVAMGLRHGVYCLGCCWVLMVLLLVGGVMNLLWVAVIGGFVLVEKLTPGRAGDWVSRAAGAGLILWGVWLGTSALL